MRIISFFNSVANMESAYIDVGSSSDWFVFNVDSTKRICNSFDGYSIPFYEYFFSKLKFRLPFNDFEEGCRDI